MTVTGPHTQLTLKAEQLRRRLDPNDLPFQTTAEVAPLVGTIGQPRALDAIDFGIQIGNKGYNLFVAGVPGSGRETTVVDYLTAHARAQPTPPDWVYVHNFVDSDRPRAIELPAGQGTVFARQMDTLMQTAKREIPRAFESDEYDRRRRELTTALTQQRNAVLGALQAFAQGREYTIEMTAAGIATVPLKEGKPLASDEYERLSDEAKQEIVTHGEEVQERIATSLRSIRQLEKQAAERVQTLDREIVMFIVGPLIDDIRDDYTLQAELQTYLDEVRNDLPNHLHDFWTSSQETSTAVPGSMEIQAQQREEHLNRYLVNVLVDNGQTKGAPIVFERNPNYYNLLGRTDYRSLLGAMVTDFRQIKPGALHRANGGFLLLEADELMRNPYAWDALKRSLMCREIQIENLGEAVTQVPTARLRPEPIPLSIKAILIGSAALYHSLLAVDDDFQELFQVKADFAPDMNWTREHVLNYAAFISREVRESHLRHFDRSAVARLVEYGARLREHQHKLSTRLLDIDTIVVEASYWAAKSGHDPVMASDVDLAIRKRIYRSNLSEERLQELIEDGTIMIDVEGRRVGQVNGLSVLNLGDYSFGRPTRITARVAIGQGSIISIEREIELSGPIHSKGVLTLSGYLGGTYGERNLLAVAATITFEQAYEGIEGDSASSTELYALLSVLSELPLDQGIAVTGSVNQYGEIQAVGGVTRKVEGFFAVCKAKGLTGRQGVMIPAANVKNLMLNDEVVQAVEDGQFSVWAVRTIDEGIEILTGVPAGKRDTDDQFPEGTVHRMVEDRIRGFAERARMMTISNDGVRVTAVPSAPDRTPADRLR